jgi:hydroxyethylthiazole kinase
MMDNATIKKIKQYNPIVLCLTNSVTENLCANTLLACGASPIMSKAQDEMDDLTKLSKALVVNIGTLEDSFLDCATRAIELASLKSIPIVIDPVGVGASHYRLKSVKKLIDIAKSVIIKGNASEIIALSGSMHSTKGVDSGDSVESAIVCAQKIMTQLTVSHIVITGKTDLIISDNKILRNDSGCKMMTRVTGMGCALAACIAAACAVESDKVSACSNMVSHYTLAAMIAAMHAKGPGSFVPAFMDALSQ